MLCNCKRPGSRAHTFSSHRCSSRALHPSRSRLRAQSARTPTATHRRAVRRQRSESQRDTRDETPRRHDLHRISLTPVTRRTFRFPPHIYDMRGPSTLDRAGGAPPMCPTDLASILCPPSLHTYTRARRCFAGLRLSRCSTVEPKPLRQAPSKSMPTVHVAAATGPGRRRPRRRQGPGAQAPGWRLSLSRSLDSTRHHTSCRGWRSRWSLHGPARPSPRRSASSRRRRRRRPSHPPGCAS